MGENASGYQQAPVGADVYWRRRVVALAACLAIFGIISWAVNGILSTSATPGTAAAGAAPAGRGPGGGAGGAGLASGSPAASPGSRAAIRTSPAGRSRHAGRGGPQQVGSQQVGSQQGSPGQGRWRRGGQPAACPRGDVVLSVHQSRAAYADRAWPRFEVDVVSTAAQPCAFNIGSRFVSVVVRSGRQALWNSAACSGGTGSRMAVLTKGVPVALHFRWDRRAGSPGCRGRGRPARPGTFVATAVSGTLLSNSLTFVLRSRSVAVPRARP